jgi:hypothetical protein
VSKLRLAFPSLIVSFVVGCAARDVPPVSAPPPASLALAVEPDEAPSLLPPDTDATEIAERWFHQSQGFNALEAYEIGGLNQKISFALARKWDGRRVKVLSYVTAPKELDELAYLILREPGRPAEGLQLRDTEDLRSRTNRRGSDAADRVQSPPVWRRPRHGNCELDRIRGRRTDPAGGLHACSAARRGDRGSVLLRDREPAGS